MVAWSTMIAVHAQHGQVRDAVKLYDEMQQEGVMPDKLTFVSILCAYSHAGLVDEGYCVFNTMHQHHGITPVVEHFNCLVGLLGRAGQLDDAESLINNMPIQPTAMSWTALLSACRNQMDMVRGEHAAKHEIELDQGTQHYV